MSEQDEQVYWVPLTPGERAVALGRIAPVQIPACQDIAQKIRCTRPEHPKRREALEELAAAVLHTQANVRGGLRCESRKDEERINTACYRLRSLEDDDKG